MNCNKCQKPNARIIEVDCGDGSFLEGSLCTGCFNAAQETLKELRVQFEALLDEGLDNATANQIMIGRIREERGKVCAAN